MRFILALFVFGGVLMYLGVQEYRLSAAAKAEPQQITCAELAANGPGKNAHVVMGDFLLWTFAYVYEEKNDKWSKIWVPAVPIGGELHQKLLTQIDADGKLIGDPPLASDVHVLVKSSHVANNDELSALADQDTVQGVVINEIESLGAEEKRILKDNYPDVDFDNCWILEADRTPATTGKIAGMLGGGIALALGGIVIFLRSRAQDAPTQTTLQPSAFGKPQ